MNKTVLFQFSICLILLSLLSEQVSAGNKFKTYEDLEKIIKAANQTGVKDFEEEIEKGELTRPVNIKQNSEAVPSTKTTLPTASVPQT